MIFNNPASRRPSPSLRPCMTTLDGTMDGGALLSATADDEVQTLAPGAATAGDGSAGAPQRTVDHLKAEDALRESLLQPVCEGAATFLAML